jgi:rare lipoprotein A
MYRHNYAFRNIAWSLVFLAIILLAGCSTTTSHRDGPPDFYVDVSKIPDAVPKVEPLSRYGNMSSYRVHGRRYYVLPNSKHFEEQGVASWYGTRFHKQRTSSGERYNMLGMTAAHKTLPLPTYVQVTNMRNGKQVIVKVNDRGPFSSNRIIDLSYVAAKKLGMLGHGTTTVDIKAIDPREAQEHSYLFAAKTTSQQPIRHTNTYAIPSPAHDAADNLLASNNSTTHMDKHQHVKSGHSVYIQVGAFRHRSNAEKLKSHLLAYSSSPVQITFSHRLYRVEIGPIRDVAAVNRMTKHLRSMGMNSKKLTNYA